jgi:hypothetical protein
MSSIKVNLSDAIESILKSAHFHFLFFKNRLTIYLHSLDFIIKIICTTSTLVQTFNLSLIYSTITYVFRHFLSIPTNKLTVSPHSVLRSIHFIHDICHQHNN